MKAILFTLFSIFTSQAFTQPCSASFNFQAGIPAGKYKQVTHKTAIGGRVNFLVKPAWQIPYLSMGLELGYQFTSTDPLSFKSSGLTYNHTFRSSYNTHVFSSLFNIRIDPAKDRAFIKPFIDIMAGCNDLFTYVKIQSETSNGYTDVAKTNKLKSQFALSYGGSAGINIRLNESGRCYLELKTMYLSGNKVNCFSDAAINNDGSATLFENRTRLSMLVHQAGLRFNLN